MEKKVKLVCDECGKTCNNLTHTVNNDNICDECRDEKFSECYHCGEYALKDDIIFIEGYHRDVCSFCREELYTYCVSCDNLVHCDYVYVRDGDDYCRDCYNNGDQAGTRPTDTKSTAHQSEKQGRIIATDRIFSAEVECYYPDVDKHNEVAQKIPKEYGITFDGSLNEDGIEFMTPLLKGEKGEKSLNDFIATLNKNGYYIDRQCGLHTHLDGKDYIGNVEAIKRLFKFYVTFEEVLLSFLPASRRTNNFCRLLRQAYHVNEINNVYNIDEIELLWYRKASKDEVDNAKTEHYEPTRYFGVNFHSLFSNGHLEVRYHSGTLNSEKIARWINLHCQIMDRVRKSDYKFVDRLAIIPATCLTLTDKVKAFFEMLELSPDDRLYFSARARKFSNASLQEEAIITN